MSAQSKETAQSELRLSSVRLDNVQLAIEKMHAYIVETWHHVLISMEQSWLGPAIDELGDSFRISPRVNFEGWNIETKVGDEWKRVVRHIAEFESPEDRVAYLETLQSALVEPYSDLLLAHLGELIVIAENDLDRLTELRVLGQKLRDQFPK